MSRQTNEDWLLDRNLPANTIVSSFPQMTADRVTNRVGMRFQHEVGLLKRCIHDIRELCDADREAVDELVSDLRVEIAKGGPLFEGAEFKGIPWKKVDNMVQVRTRSKDE